MAEPHMDGQSGHLASGHLEKHRLGDGHLFGRENSGESIFFPREADSVSIHSEAHVDPRTPLPVFNGPDELATPLVCGLWRMRPVANEVLGSQWGLHTELSLPESRGY